MLKESTVRGFKVKRKGQVHCSYQQWSGVRQDKKWNDLLINTERALGSRQVPDLGSVGFYLEPTCVYLWIVFMAVGLGSTCCGILLLRSKGALRLQIVSGAGRHTHTALLS